MNHFIQFVEKAKATVLLQIFTIYLRYLLGGAFVIAAIVMGKLSNVPMTLTNHSIPIGDLQPLQQFFRVMIDSGLYWNFIGWMQIVSGVLLMTQRFAKVGALLFFGMILNIFIITVSYGFIGTPIITGLMLLGATYLLLWDIASLQYMVLAPSKGNLPKQSSGKMIDSNYWTGLGLIMLISVITGSLLKWTMVIVLLMPVVQGLIGLIAYFFLVKKSSIMMMEPVEGNRES